MIELDKNSNNILTRNELWGGSSEFTKYLDRVAEQAEDTESEGYTPPSIEEFLAAFIKTMNDLRKMSKHELEKLGIDSNTIDLNASAQEVFKQIMEQDNSTEILKNIQEKFGNQNENIKNVANKNTISHLKENTEQQTENTTLKTKEDNSIFAEIAKLTKLDEETLAHNLQNNPNFEEDIISIVQELTQNVDRIYLNVLERSRKTLDIVA